MGFVYSCMSSKSPVNLFVWNHKFSEKIVYKTIFLGDAPENSTIEFSYMYL